MSAIQCKVCGGISDSHAPKAILACNGCYEKLYAALAAAEAREKRLRDLLTDAAYWIEDEGCGDDPDGASDDDHCGKHASVNRLKKAIKKALAP